MELSVLSNVVNGCCGPKVLLKHGGKQVKDASK